jgi:hypothetical protein
MSLDFIEFLNHPLSFGLDPKTVRLSIALMVAVAAWLWPTDMRTYWAVWTRRGRRLTSWMFAVIVVVGIVLIASAQRQDPIRVSTWLLAAVFLGLNVAMLFRPANDNTTDRQYAHWFRRTR